MFAYRNIGGQPRQLRYSRSDMQTFLGNAIRFRSINRCSWHISVVCKSGNLHRARTHRTKRKKEKKFRNRMTQRTRIRTHARSVYAHACNEQSCMQARDMRRNMRTSIVRFSEKMMWKIAAIRSRASSFFFLFSLLFLSSRGEKGEKGRAN